MNLFNKLAAVGLSTVLLAGLTACDKNKVSDNAPNRPDVSVVGVAHS